MSYVILDSDEGHVYAGPVHKVADYFTVGWTENVSEATWFATKMQARRIAREIDKWQDEQGFHEVKNCPSEVVSVRGFLKDTLRKVFKGDELVDDSKEVTRIKNRIKKGGR